MESSSHLPSRLVRASWMLYSTSHLVSSSKTYFTWFQLTTDNVTWNLRDIHIVFQHMIHIIMMLNLIPQAHDKRGQKKLGGAGKYDNGNIFQIVKLNPSR